MQLLTAFEFQDHDAHIAAHMAFMAIKNGSNQSTSICIDAITHI